MPRGSIAPKPGLAALEQFEALAQGKLKAIWILCTNPAASAPDIDLIEKALRQAELVVVQDGLSSDSYQPFRARDFTSSSMERKRRRDDQFRAARHLYAEACRAAG